MTGRRTKLTTEAVDAFLQATRLGVSRDLAASAAGWSRAAAFGYLDRGRRARAQPRIPAREQPFVDFVDAVEKAEATMVQAALAQIVRAAQMPQHWTAAAWLLERRWPEMYGRRAAVAVTGPNGGPIPVEVTASELLDQLRRIGDEEERVETHRRRLRVVIPEAVGNGHDPNYRVDDLDEEG